MLRVGLSGGIGSGKSTVAGRLAEHGAVLIDSDKLAREVVEPGTEGLAEIVEAFGQDVLDEHGALNRAALAAKVFTNETNRKTLNAIVHPRVGARTAELLTAAAPDAIVVHDIPLLVENDVAPAYHLVIIVHADPDERVRRLTTSRGMSETDARNRIASQADDDQRRAVADVWLDNSGTPDLVLAAVDELWADRLVSYEANIRLRRFTPRGPKVVPYDETWPEQATRVANRIRLAAGGLRVEHIGSTAVPGLAAKDVLDFQLGVPSLEVADELAEQLGDAGFPRLEGAYEDTPKPAGADPELWRKRLHVGADPRRRVNLHVRVEGGPAWEWALRFRDWLRTSPDEVADYQELKLELAAEHASDDTMLAYAEAKEPWMAAASERMGYTGGQTS
ncbi:dephospho-CoA kinase [Umezawaea sp. Da 62-37]|uniref:dephospho-CoA kinase n=1 Tax=Umezawaea sp. Da 62-37 TaxID=3075927 RepID=UPI0028F6DDC7|nr:dephospho-CoA kinase [Umezawaea sp. Da 62-37]WNV89538.1 dephospho-CoA kinase [Umezawaea sp. Da 62-37]